MSISVNHPCYICGSSTLDIGRKFGIYARQWFQLRHCPTCRFSFVANPWLEFEKIYSAEYYAGKGADPLVDYEYELTNPAETIRHYEWSGIYQLVTALSPVTAGTRWLDFGCGNGGLVRYIRTVAHCPIEGFEEGAIQGRASAEGIPFLTRDELETRRGSFNIVTAIEVLEHVSNPLEVLKEIRGLLKPGGLFFFTTGNAEPFRGRLHRWRYVVPEVHVSFFEPTTLERALRVAGFAPEFRGFLPGDVGIIRFKVLKNLRQRRRSAVESAVPWRVITRIVNRRLGVTAHPFGRATADLPPEARR